MNWLSNIKLGVRLNLIVGVLVAVIITLLGGVTYYYQKSQTLKDVDERMSEQVADLSEIVEQQIKQKQEFINTALITASFVLKNSGNFILGNDNITFKTKNQVPEEISDVTVRQWLIGNKQVQNSIDIVDHIKAITNATATIFQRIPQGFLRISTNVMTSSGERAIGTFIPIDSPVAKVVASGQTFQGRAFVVNDYYLTAYEPIRMNGDVIGMLYVGVPEKNLLGIKNYFNSKKYYVNGYPFMLEKSGLLIVHPNQEGDNIKDKQFYQKLLKLTSNSGNISYKWPENASGRDKKMYYHYIPLADSYVCSSIYIDDVLIPVYRIRIMVITGVFLAIVIFIVFLTLFSRTITNPLTRSVAFANQIAQGDLTSKINLSRGDEIGALVTSLNSMVGNVKRALEEVDQSAGSITDASAQLSSNSQLLSQAASQMASSVQEISSSMEEMASNIDQNTQNSRETEKIALNVTSSIDQVQEASVNSYEAIQKITEKINIIGDIAFQTNILALNAAVEAARAGEYGRGFAVVAAEVRNLAERSKVAADEIIHLSKTSLNITKESTELIALIIPEIKKTAKLVQEITASSIEQSSGTDQVNKGVQQLNDMSQQTAASSEELASNAEELNSQAEQLKEVIGFFKM